MTAMTAVTETRPGHSSHSTNATYRQQRGHRSQEEPARIKSTSARAPAATVGRRPPSISSRVRPVKGLGVLIVESFAHLGPGAGGRYPAVCASPDASAASAGVIGSTMTSSSGPRWVSETSRLVLLDQEPEVLRQRFERLYLRVPSHLQSILRLLDRRDGRALPHGQLRRVSDRHFTVHDLDGIRHVGERDPGQFNHDAVGFDIEPFGALLLGLDQRRLDYCPCAGGGGGALRPRAVGLANGLGQVTATGRVTALLRAGGCRVILSAGRVFAGRACC